MEESDDNLSSEDINSRKSPATKNKSKKRSLVERELETSLTARVISPIPAVDGCSTSRYGRARKLKNDSSETEKYAKMPKSPKTEISPKSLIQSPVYKMHASNSPIKLDSQKPEPFESQIENIYSENNSLSRFGSAEKKISPSKRYPKVYIRKDLTQLKDKDKEAEETVVLIKNMFSPTKSAQKSNRTSLERSMEKHGKRKLPTKDTQSVVKTLDFDDKDIKKGDKRDIGKIGLSKSEIFEIEAKSDYQVGDLAWARMGTYPFWPCIITREPGSGLFVKTKLFGRTVRNILNVTFFGDNGRRSWIADSMLRPFLGQLEFETTRAHFTSEAKKKDPKLYAAYFISERKMPQWLLSVEEAETLLREPKRLRIDILSSMLVKVRPEKVTAKSEKGKRVTRTDSDVSLSESLYDTLFSEDDTKGNDSDRRNKRKQSLDVSEVVTACLDNMAAKTGITKIQKQSHMDRWLLKAKTKTPEKSQLKSHSLQKAAKTSGKTNTPTLNISHKPYRFRSRHNESQGGSSSILNDNSEPSTSSDYKPASVSNDIVMENSSDRLNNESYLTDVLSENTSESSQNIAGNDIYTFKSPLSETEKTVSFEGKNVLNKIKQSIDSDENMHSTSSVNVSGMSTSFEISRVDSSQSSDKEIIESDLNENVSEITDDKISHLNITTSNTIDESKPITSSPKNCINDIEITAEVLNDCHKNEGSKFVEEFTTGDKSKSKECTNKEDECKDNDCVKNVSSDNFKCNVNTIHEIKKSSNDNENESVLNKKPFVKLDETLSIFNGVHEVITENDTNFRKDKKIKTKQKTGDDVANEFSENKELSREEKLNLFIVNTCSIRSKKLRESDENIDSDIDKSKCNDNDLTCNEIDQENVAIISVLQNKSKIDDNDDLKQSFLHKCIMNIESNEASKANIKQKLDENDKSLLLKNKQNEDSNMGTLNLMKSKYNQSINSSEALNTTETKLKQNDFMTSDKDSPQNDLMIRNSVYENPAFQKYLQLKQDNVMDEYPELSLDEITSYLYKTWQYETKDIIDNKVIGEANKIPAKGTNYKALDKERGRKKLVRKKPADFIQDKISVPLISTNIPPVNGYHKEIKPIVISPKNKIIFLPRNSITDSVKSNISFNDFKLSNTPIMAKVQTPLKENEVSISSESCKMASIAETITYTKSRLDSEWTSVTKVEYANQILLNDKEQDMQNDKNKGNNLKAPKNENALLNNLKTKMSTESEKLIFKPQSHRIHKTEPSTIEADNNNSLSPTDTKMDISLNGPEISSKSNALQINDYTGTIGQKLTHALDGYTKVTTVPDINSITKSIQTSQNENVFQMSSKNDHLSPTISTTEDKVKNINNNETGLHIKVTNSFDDATVSSEYINFKETNVLNNSSLTKNKQIKPKLKLKRSNCEGKSVTVSSSLKETGKSHITVPNNIVQNENETSNDNGLSPDKLKKYKFEKCDSTNESKCLIKSSIAHKEENVKPIYASKDSGTVEVTQVGNYINYVENFNTENVTLTSDKKCLDSGIKYDKMYINDRNEAVSSNTINSELNSKIDSLLENNTQNTILHSDEKEQTNITSEKTIDSFSATNTTSIENDETKSTTQYDLTEIINNNSGRSSQQPVENVVLENPEFQKYFEFKQDSVIDEHPELSRDEVIQYLYKTWLYEETNKSEKIGTDEVDQTSLVKGVNIINEKKDMKRKKLSRKRPSDSLEKKIQPTFINKFFNRNGIHTQFEETLNPKSELQASFTDQLQQNEILPNSKDSDKCDVVEEVVNQEQNTIQGSSFNNDVESKEAKDQNLNESTEYEPEKDSDDKVNNKDFFNDGDNLQNVSSSSTDSESEISLSIRKRQRKQKRKQAERKRALMDPEFVRYLELRQDAVIDDNPELSHEEVIQYLYKTWRYEEVNKSEKKIIDEVDQTSLVKGVSTIYADKGKRKKLSRWRPSDFSKAKKKPTMINQFLMQNGYHEYHEKSLNDDDQDVTLNTISQHQNIEEEAPETDNDDMSVNEEIISADKSNSESYTSSDSELEMSLIEKKRIWKQKRAQAEKKKSLMDAEFVRYLELRQDYVMDEHPELTEEEITNYLYKTWLYEEKIKNDKKLDDDIDQTSLVKGVDLEPKKSKRKYKIIKEDSQESFKVSEDIKVEPKEKSKRSTARPYYNEEISDIEQELALFEIFRKKKTNKLNMEQQVDSIQSAQDVALTQDTEEVSNPDDYVFDEMDMVELYFDQLTTPKPNVFKGLVRERVCEICEKVSNVVKCKTCHGMFHADCVKNQRKAPQIEEKTPSRGRKKKRKYQRRIKNNDETFVDDDGHSDERPQDGNSDPNLSIEAEKEPIVIDAEEFEAKASAKMREMLGDMDNVNYDYESTNAAISWNARPGKCQIVDVKLETREVVDASNFKCNDCKKTDTPKCFVCKSPVSPKDRVEYRQKCQVAHCYKYYHLECLAHWPQTQFNGGDVRNKSKERFEAMSCPRHVCHTCVSDDPRGCKTRFSGDKLARCVRCPATYHSFTKCLPAGSQILTGSQIICPRHYEHRPGKVPCHVNTGWCFICALGGTLICCEYCPTSFHAECLNIDPPEGGYMCEDCETGRLPLYGEMVWVKLGHYRWWPGIILHPSQVPANIMAVKHSMGEFVVRFFGQYDHYWVNRGRVFPFQEGDTGKISSQKSKIDSAFTLAVEHASRACEILKKAIPNDEESQDIASSLLPPHYVKLKVNKPVGSLVSRRIDIEESSLTQCECDPGDAEPCGPYSQCLNRMLLTECGPTCRAGERCNNRAFERRQYPRMAPYRTPHRGWGLRCLEDIRAGQFVIEYVGELLDEVEFQRRMRRKHEVRDENYYFLALDKERMIDAGPKGNLARFMNHSCEPNCETQKWTVLGDVRVGLFAIDDIPANSELTFNYNLESAGIEKKQCMCGAKRCSGYIGAKPKQGDPQPKKNKIVKKIQRKSKKPESPQQKRPRGRPSKPKELTEIEKDLLIIKNATNASEKDIIAIKNSSVSSESEYSERCSVDSKDGKAAKRKRSSQESLTLCLKRVKTGEGDEFRID